VIREKVAPHKPPLTTKEVIEVLVSGAKNPLHGSCLTSHHPDLTLGLGALDTHGVSRHRLGETGRCRQSPTNLPRTLETTILVVEPHVPPL
jgi:hypothetical protein